MVIEIDRKKIGRGKKHYRWMMGLYIFIVVLMLFIYIVQGLQYGTVPLLRLELFNISVYLLCTVIFVLRMRRSRRQVRTDHHLHLDEVGVTAITGHERIDIPWGDIKKISYPIGFHSSSAKKNQHKSNQMRFTLHLRPDTPYNKRKYRIYNDYEMSIHDLAEHVEELWFVGRDKMKTTTL